MSSSKLDALRARRQQNAQAVRDALARQEKGRRDKVRRDRAASRDARAIVGDADPKELARINAQLVELAELRVLLRENRAETEGKIGDDELIERLVAEQSDIEAQIEQLLEELGSDNKEGTCLIADLQAAIQAATAEGEGKKPATNGMLRHFDRKCRDLGLSTAISPEEGERRIGLKRLARAEDPDKRIRLDDPRDRRDVVKLPVMGKERQFTYSLWGWVDEPDSTQGKAKIALIRSVNERFNELWFLARGEQQGRREDLGTYRQRCKDEPLTVAEALAGKTGWLELRFEKLPGRDTRWPVPAKKGKGPGRMIQGSVFLHLFQDRVARVHFPRQSPLYRAALISGLVEEGVPQKGFGFQGEFDDVWAWGDGEQLRNQRLARKFLRLGTGIETNDVDAAGSSVKADGGDDGEAPEVSASEPVARGSTKSKRRDRRGETQGGDGEGRTRSRRPDASHQGEEYEFDGEDEGDEEDSEAPRSYQDPAASDGGEQMRQALADAGVEVEDNNPDSTEDTEDEK